jgi:hypothetical protein
MDYWRIYKNRTLARSGASACINAIKNRIQLIDPK